VLSVAVQVQQDCGSVLACALNAVSVALLDAGVPLKRMFAAVTVAIPSSGRYALDPDKAEEEMEAATLTAAFAIGSFGPDGAPMEASAEDKARGKGVLAGLGTGVVSQQDMVAGLDAALRASKQVGAIIRDAMVAGLQAEDA